MRFVVGLLLLAACGAAPLPRARHRAVLTPLAEPAEPARDDKPPSGALRLFLTDADSGAPVSLRIQLWRLGLSEDDDWTAGDGLQARFGVPEEGLWIGDLPEGRYRIYSDSLRFGSADPPAFEVSGEETVVDLYVPTCQERRVHLKIFDEAGRLLESARRRDRGSSWITREDAGFPAWRVERKSKRAGFRRPSGSVPSCGSGPEEFRPVAAGPWGFDLGEFRDDSRGAKGVSWHEFETRQRTAVWLRLERETTRDRTYVGVAFSDKTVKRSVFLPGGTLAAENHGISVICRAVLEGDDLVPVKVMVAGFEPEHLLCRIGESFPICQLQRKTRRLRE